MTHIEIAALNEYKKIAKRAARDFHYPDDVITEINEAKSETAVANVMTRARQLYL